MKYIIPISVVLAVAAAIWRIGPDTSGQPARLVFDTPDRQLSIRTPHPVSSIPFGPATSPTGNGAELFARHCAHCHGTNGSGQSYVSRYAGMPSVGNLQTSERSAQELHHILRDGRGAMPAFGQRLQNTDRNRLIDFIHTSFRQVP